MKPLILDCPSIQLNAFLQSLLEKYPKIKIDHIAASQGVQVDALKQPYSTVVCIILYTLPGDAEIDLQSVAESATKKAQDFLNKVQTVNKKIIH